MKIENLSAVIITKNEEANIERCLRSLNWIEDVVVYDSGSVDQTLVIAKKMGAKVFEGEWKGYGPTKIIATGLAKNDWILSVDADEEVSPQLCEEIQNRITSKNLKPEVGYQIPRLSFYLKKWIHHGGWFPDYQLRLFHRQHSMWNANTIHEKVESRHQEKLANNLNHYVFKNISHQIFTNDRYSTLQAQKMFEQTKKFSWFHMLTKPTVKFLECYILKLGFLDGWPGYVIARNAAHSVFLKWNKLYELEQDSRK